VTRYAHTESVITVTAQETVAAFTTVPDRRFPSVSATRRRIPNPRREPRR